MQGSKKAPLPGSVSNASSGSRVASQRRMRMCPSFGASCRRRRIVPGLVSRLGIIRAAVSSLNPSGASSDSASVVGIRNEGDKPEPTVDAASRRPTRTLYKVSDDPLLRETQMLLEASRRLREQTVPTVPIVDQQAYYDCSNSPTGGPKDVAGQRFGVQTNDLQIWEGNEASSSMQVAQETPDGVVASFGMLAAASATAAARISAARSVASSQTTGTSYAMPLVTAAAPGHTVSTAVLAATAGHSALTTAATTASIAAAAAVMPPAANASGGASLSAAAASAASAAATVASSGWLAIEELLEEAAYSLSQELPDGQGPSPLEALMASTSGGRSSGFGSPGAVMGLDLPQQLPESLTAPLSLPLTGLGLGSAASGTAGSGSLVAAVPGGDRLSEMLEDMLYNLSQDINLAATQEAVLSAATSAAAGLAGAAAELPRAAFSVYRSAAEAAAAAAAARAAAALGPTSGGSGGTALVVPDEGQTQQTQTFDEQYDAGEEYDVAELGDIEDVVGAGNPTWDPYGTIRATEGSQVVPDYSAAPTAAAAAAADLSGDALTNGASAAAAAASEGAAAVLQPIITASAAPSLADAATATAVAVVEAATTAAAGTIIITPPSPAPPLVSQAAVPSGSSTDSIADSGVAASSNAVALPPQTADSITTAVPPQPALTQPPALSGDNTMYGTDTYELNAEDIQQLDELTAALQNLLADSEGLPSIAGAASSGLEAVSPETADAAAAMAAAASTAAFAPDDPALLAAEATMSSFAEALRQELGAVVANASDAVDADPAALAQSAGQAVRSALGSLSLEQQINLSAMPQDLRLSTLLGATVQSALDLVESALSGIRSADSTLVGGLTIAAVLAVLIRSLVSMAGVVLNRNQAGSAEGSAGLSGGAGSGSESAARLRPVGVTALEAAAALNNDPQALLVDVRNDSDVREQGLPDLRPFRRGTGATTIPLPYCDFRTTPTLANPSGSLLAGSRSRDKRSAASTSGSHSSSTALAPVVGTVTVSVDPLFCSKFKQFEGLNRDSRVFLMDSYGVEAPEAVLLLRSDPEIERLLGAQGVKYLEGGFAGPEGWKLTGLPVADAPGTASEGAGNETAGGLGLGLDLSGLLSGVAGLRLRYPSLFTRTLAVGAVGGAGLAVASSLDWGAVSRGAVCLAAAMLLTDQALPPGMRPSGRIRQYLQSQLSETQLGGSSSAADLTARRRRTALLLRVLDLAEAVGSAVVRAGGTAITIAGNAARGTIASRNSTADAAVVPAPKAGAVDLDANADLETAPSPATGAAAAAAIVLPHGMDSPQWNEAAELAVAQRLSPPPSPSQQQQQQGPTTAATALPSPQKQTKSVSPLRPNWRLGSSTPADSSSPSLSAATAAATAAAAGPDTIAAAAAASGSGLLPPRSPSPSLAGRLSDALQNAASAVVRAASPSRAASVNSTAMTRAASPGGGTPRPDTLELMAALATASALSNVDSGLLPGWPASSFPKASAGQMSTTASRDEGQADKAELGTGQASTAGKLRDPVTEKDAAEKEVLQRQLGGSSLHLFSSRSVTRRSSDQMEAEAAEAAGDLWSNWRQELEAVAPPPPTLPSVDDDGNIDDAIREVGSRSGANAEHSLYGSGSASVAASRLDLTSSSWSRGISPNKGANDTAGITSAPAGSSNGSSDKGDGLYRQQHQHQERQQSRKMLRTSSPERAAAAGAALRQLRMQMDGLDDDGLASGAYGTGETYSGSDSGDTVAGGKRSGSGRVAVARMAPGRGGLSRGLAAEPQQQELLPPSGAGGAGGRQKQPLRTASPQRAAAAAAAMRQLRAELGLPPNDGREADAVVPRDWRREMDAAAAAGVGSFSDSDSELEPAERLSLYGGSNMTNSVNAATGDKAAAAVTIARPSPSPRNWRAQLEGRDQPESSSSTGAAWGRRRSDSGVPANWRVQIEAADGNGNGNTHDNGLLVPQMCTTSSPGRAKLTAAERAARDARLHDWRARV